MKTLLLNLGLLTFTLLTTINFNSQHSNTDKQSFQGKAYYMSKARMDLGTWGARLSEGQKKEIQEPLKNRLEKTYILNFNKEESVFDEDEKLDAISGATDSWGKNFAPGEQYKNVKNNSQIQNQEFYGKQFLVKDQLQPIEWQLGEESKQIGNYLCFKATASIPTNDLTWYSFSWNKLRNTESDSEDKDGESEIESIAMTEVEAWYTPQVPVAHGPSEYWGLPGLILEVSAGDTTMLCSKLIINPESKIDIEAPEKGKVVSKKEYQEIIFSKMKEFRENRMGRGRG